MSGNFEKTSRRVWMVKDWDAHFENAWTRKRAYLHTCFFKNTHGGLGFKRLMEKGMPGVTSFGAFVVLIELLSQQLSPRGGFLTEDGSPDSRPLDSTDLYMRTGVSKKAFDKMFGMIGDEVVGWLENVVVETEVVENKRVVKIICQGVGKVVADEWHSTNRLNAKKVPRACHVETVPRVRARNSNSNSNSESIAPGCAGGHQVDLDKTFSAEDFPAGVVPRRKCTAEQAMIVLHNVHGNEPIPFCKFVAEHWVQHVDGWADGWKRMGSWEAHVKAYFTKNCDWLRDRFEKSGGEEKSSPAFKMVGVCKVCGGLWGEEVDKGGCSCVWNEGDGDATEWMRNRRELRRVEVSR